MDGDDLESRLAAVERALSEDEAGRIDDAATLARRVDDAEAAVADLESRVADLEAATQAVRGYLGDVRAADEAVERRADAALATAEAAARTVDASGRAVDDDGDGDPVADAPDEPRPGRADGTSPSRSAEGPDGVPSDAPGGRRTSRHPDPAGDAGGATVPGEDAFAAATDSADPRDDSRGGRRAPAGGTGSSGDGRRRFDDAAGRPGGARSTTRGRPGRRERPPDGRPGEPRRDGPADRRGASADRSSGPGGDASGARDDGGNGGGLLARLRDLL
jgi:hypothetical protein